MSMQNRNEKLKGRSRNILLILIAIGCIAVFAVALGTVLSAQAATDTRLNTLSTANIVDANTLALEQFEGLDIQVTNRSLNISGAMEPEAILPIAQKVLARVFDRQFTGFVFLDCYTHREDYGYPGLVWRICGTTGIEESIDMYFDAETGRDISCNIEERIIATPEDVAAINTQEGTGTRYVPIAPPGYELGKAENMPDVELTDEQIAYSLSALYERRQELVDYIELHRNDAEVANAKQIVEQRGLSGDASVLDIYLLRSEEGDSPRGYGHFYLFEVKLDNGEYLIIGTEAQKGFYGYSRVAYSELDALDAEVEALGGGRK